MSAAAAPEPSDPLAAQLKTAHAELEERLGAMMEEHQRTLITTIVEFQLALQKNFQVRRTSNDSDTDPPMKKRGSTSSSGAPARGTYNSSAYDIASTPPTPGRGASMRTQRTSMSFRSEAPSEAPTESVVGGMSSMHCQQTQLADIQRNIMRGPRANSVISLSVRAQSFRSYARTLKESQWFELAVAICIAVNTASIGLNADWSMKNLGKERPTTFAILDYSFLGIFALELLVRVLSEGAHFFEPGRRGFAWNVFDTLIVVFTSLNELNPLTLNLSVVRALRPLRLVHVVRMIRLLDAFRELRMMVTGILNCGKTLLWSVVLLGIVTYIYSVFCLQLCADWLGSLDDASVAANPKVQVATEKFDKNIPSLSWCAYTLFKAMTNGLAWGDELADPLVQVGPLMGLSFVAFITVTVLCVLNVITAAFVDAAARTSQDDDANTLDHINVRREWMKKITALFDKHDHDKDGHLDWGEFKTVAMDWRTQAYFREIALDFDYQNARQMFHLFDWDQNGRINIDEFAQGIHHLRGTARSLDMFRQFHLLGQRVERALKKSEQDSHGHVSRPTVKPDRVLHHDRDLSGSSRRPSSIVSNAGGRDTDHVFEEEVPGASLGVQSDTGSGTTSRPPDIQVTADRTTGDDAGEGTSMHI